MQKRKLFSSGLTLGLVVFVGFPSHAELIKNLKTDGSIEVRTFGIDNEVDHNGATDDYRSDMRTRIMVGGTFDVLDDVHGRVLLRKNNRLYGQAGENVNSVQTAIAVDNAYTKIDKVFGAVDLTMGRQFYGDSNDPNIYFGPNNDDLLTVGALDAFRADADLMGWAKFQGIAGKTVESTPASATAPAGPTNTNSDTDLWGAQVMTDKVIPKGGLLASYYTLKGKNPLNTGGNNTLAVGQLCALGDLILGLSYHVDFMQDFGRNNAVAGTPAYDGTAYFLGLKFAQELSGMPFRAHGEYGRGSDNFVAISPGKRFGVIWGEHSNAAGAPSLQNRTSLAGNVGATGGAGLSNLKLLDAGVGINPIAKLGFDLNWYRFQYDANLGNVGTSAGTEYDFIVSWKHSDNVSLEASAATFQVGSAMSNPAPIGTNPVTRLGADVKVKF